MSRYRFSAVVKICILLLLLSFGVIGIYSQFKESAMLNQADVYCKFVDSEGYEWYGTRDGLKRYDGYTYETFRSDRNNPDLLRSNDVMYIAEDSTEHDMWFGTKNGAYVLSKKDYSIHELHIYSNDKSAVLDSMELMDKRINSIYCSSDGHIWISYRNQILELDKEHMLIHRYETHWKGKNRSSIHLLEDESSCMWTNLWNGGICRKPKDADDFMACEWTDTSYPSEIRLDPSLNCIIATTPEGSTYRYASDGTLLPDSAATSEKVSLPSQFFSDEEKALEE